MRQEERKVCYDEVLQIEAYRFIGIMQKFPNHFHEHYVIGFIEAGRRHLSCKNQEFQVEPGDLLLFNPKDNHTCEQIDQGTLDYRCLNISVEMMEKVYEEVCEEKGRPYFEPCVVFHSELVPLLKEIHQMIMDEKEEMAKEEAYYFLMDALIKVYDISTQAYKGSTLTQPIEKACQYMKQHFKEQMALKELCQEAGLSKYTLLRNFTAQCGVTPFQYLETIRINYAKQLLEKGNPLSEVAYESGFSDQSHFTRFFKNYIGLTPKQYQNIFKEQKDES